MHQKADHIYDYPKRINFLQNGEIVKGVAFDPCIVIWGLHPRGNQTMSESPMWNAKQDEYSDNEVKK